VAAEGAIYDFYEDKYPYVRDPDSFPTPYEHLVGIDYGTGNPTAMILMGRDPVQKPGQPQIWAVDEYFYDSVKSKRQKTDEEYAKDFIDFIKGRTPMVTSVYVDPSAASLKIALRAALTKNQLYCTIKDAVNDVLNGIRVQGTMLRNGRYAISTKCKRTRTDYLGYVWDSKAQERGEDRPLKTGGADHTQDAQRYPIYTIFGDELRVDLSGLSTQTGQ
jgi:hypothetical protein